MLVHWDLPCLPYHLIKKKKKKGDDSLKMEIIAKVNCSLCCALVFVSSNWKLLHFCHERR